MPYGRVQVQRARVPWRDRLCPRCVTHYSHYMVDSLIPTEQFEPLPAKGVLAIANSHRSIGLDAIESYEAESPFPIKSVGFQREGVVARTALPHLCDAWGRCACRAKRIRVVLRWAVTINGP